MPQKIFILPDNVVNKIAAGEVVQRPGAALKELLENSIDSGATKIEVEIKEGGKTFILIRDNGCGMSKEDTLASVERHSTSKIKNIDDLLKIETFGFRGEALASIASVSQFELKSKTAQDEIGTSLKISGGKTDNVESISHQVGTTIIIKNLFFNIPARLQFLKTNQTEFRNCLDAFTQIAIAHPDVEFKFSSNDELLLNLSNEDLPSRIESIFGEKIIETILPIKEENDYLKVSGFISKPNFARKAKKDQFIFLNNRFIQSHTIQHAVYSGYEHLIEKGSYPFFVLNLEILQKNVDVNVHPSKLTVKFSDENMIYRSVNRAVRHALMKTNLTPVFNIPNNAQSPQTNQSFNFQTINFKNRFEQNPTQNNVYNRSEEEITERTKNQIPNQNDKLFLGQINKKYLLFQTKDGILIIDQHVAHERILYEEFSEYFNSNSSKSQQLLFPITIKLSQSDFSIVKEIIKELNSVGFQIKEFGGTTIAIDAIPIEIKIGKEEKILQEVIDEFKMNLQKEKIDVRDNIAKSLACKAAIKAGDELSNEEVNKLIDELFKTKIPYACPHGRPVIVSIPISELDKRFMRI